MKVLFVVHAPMGYGTYYRAYYLAKYLASSYGYDVTLICAKSRQSTHNSDVNQHVRVITSPILRDQRDYAGEALRASLNVIHSFVSKYDIAHVFTTSQPSTGMPALSSKLLGRTLFVDWDDLWGGGFAQFYNPLIERVMEFMESLVPKVADGVTVVSDVLYEKAKSLGVEEEEIYKVPNGANVDEVYPVEKTFARRVLGLNFDGPIMVTVAQRLGYSTTYKVLNVLQRVLKQRKDVKLVIAGRVMLSEDSSRIYRQVRENILMLGLQPYNRVKYVLGAADVLLLPMDDSPVERARWPIRLGDYLASGRPIVSNAVGEVKKVLEDSGCGLTCSINDVEEFSGKILELLADEELSENFGRRAREVAEKKYSWRIITGKLSDIYSTLS